MATDTVKPLRGAPAELPKQAALIDDSDFAQLCNALLAMDDDDPDCALFGLACPAMEDTPSEPNPVKLPLTDVARRGTQLAPLQLVPVDEACAASPDNTSLSVDSHISLAELLEDASGTSDPFSWPEGAELFPHTNPATPIIDASRTQYPASPPPTSEPPLTSYSASRASSPSEGADEVAPAGRGVKRAQTSGTEAEGACSPSDSPGLQGLGFNPGLDPSLSLEEKRRLKRMAKNRRTAAESRERKKAAAAEAAREAATLRDENARLKAALQAAESRAHMLEGQLASLYRGASPTQETPTPTTTAAVKHTEPAEPVPNSALSITLPPVRPQPPSWSVSPSSSSPDLCTALLLLSCVAMSCQAANSAVEAFAQAAVQLLRRQAHLTSDPVAAFPDLILAAKEALEPLSSSPASTRSAEAVGHQHNPPTSQTSPPRANRRQPSILSPASADSLSRLLPQQCSSALLNHLPLSSLGAVRAC
eukprot:jgi/Tetstr1/437936/TSEL_026566.t1